MSKPTALSIGIARGGLEIKQFMRQRESVVFTMLFPLILLAIFGSVFSNSIAKGVTFSQYFVAGHDRIRNGQYRLPATCHHDSCGARFWNLETIAWHSDAS